MSKMMGSDRKPSSFHSKFFSFLRSPPVTFSFEEIHLLDSYTSTMATAGNEMAPSDSGGRARDKLQKSSSGMSSDQVENATTGILELERISKQPTFTSRYRSKIQHPAATIENLPDELLINIFIRLLAKQLAQMRSVSKSWNALLSQPSFIKSHLHRSIRDNNEQVLLVLHNFHEPFKQYSYKSPHLKPTNFIKNIPIDLPRRVIGSVNGLICLSGFYYSNIRIWNPSLSAVSNIPPLHSLTRGFPCTHNLRFGFDPKTDDYKLVKISCDRNFENNVKEWLQIEVYSMRKRSWQFITQKVPSHITRILDADYLCGDGHDGYLHWQIEPVVKTEERKILAFDLGSETFREIPLPLSILYSSRKGHRFGVLGGKLCEMSWRMDGAWEVWVMEEYGVPESWVKRHVFSQFKDVPVHCLYGFTSRNELLLTDKGRRVTLYDPIANKSKKTRTRRSVERIVEYVDSLVWV